jgi:hypothetical protein
VAQQKRGFSTIKAIRQIFHSEACRKIPIQPTDSWWLMDSSAALRWRSVTACLHVAASAKAGRNEKRGESSPRTDLKIHNSDFVISE